MKKIIGLSIAIVCLVLLGYLGYKVFIIIQQKQIAEKNTALLPTFSFVATNNKTFKNADLENVNGRIIFNFFSPTCEHCQNMATQYLNNKEQIKDITILMVTIADSISVAKFKNDYQLNTLPNLILLRDTKFQFYKIFGTATVPAFFIYEHQTLVKKIIGETKIENLIAPFNSPEGEK
ncbi:MAG: redoxin domain-containing protein [Bacteroidota bacterium]|nr:redoxin domain-containing protein [Bacteroidota bacterium]